jgi:hypothetical protein
MLTSNFLCPVPAIQMEYVVGKTIKGKIILPFHYFAFASECLTKTPYQRCHCEPYPRAAWFCSKET